MLVPTHHDFSSYRAALTHDAHRARFGFARGESCDAPKASRDVCASARRCQRVSPRARIARNSDRTSRFVVPRVPCEPKHVLWR
jgi:hypothetical protein